MKRKRQSRAQQRENKRVKQDGTQRERPSQPLLRNYYPEVVTLRQYLVSKLVKPSKRTRRRILQYGRDGSEADERVTRLLDTTVIGAFESVHIPSEEAQSIENEIKLFSQQIASDRSSVALTPNEFKQAQFVDFVIWLLFRRNPAKPRIDHVLCQGLQRYLPTGADESAVASGIPGVWTVIENEHTRALKKHPWNAIPDLLGDKAERVICDLLLNCGIFVPVADSSNMTQVSGVPMHQLSILKSSHTLNSASNSTGTATPGLQKCSTTRNATRGWSDIRFVRHRMLYTRPATTKKGDIRPGLSPIHVLNRFRNLDDDFQTCHVMKHIFPRQFGLHNVFESPTDPRETATTLKDYTMREREIEEHTRLLDRKRTTCNKNPSSKSAPLPKRLRGLAFELCRSIRIRHSRCPYAALFDYYCANSRDTHDDPLSSTRQATRISQITAFCKAVVRAVFPSAIWGRGEAAKHNTSVLNNAIDTFIGMRRFESISLHNVMHCMKIKHITWLVPPKQAAGDSLSQTDLGKRSELMAEMMYYIFDSFLIPLIRAHFYVTESSAFRNQLFYFRHDAWKRMSEPALGMLKETMLEECSPIQIRQTLQKRALGVSHVRLLPKESGMRPIINLRRRVQMTKNGTLVLGRSINKILTPAFSVLNYEKTRGSNRLGSALFSVDDILPRLQRFRQSLAEAGLLGKPLYFAKVDVQACFDSIPQKRLMELVHTIMTTNQYTVARYSRAKLLGSDRQSKAGFGTIPSWKFLTTATSTDEGWSLAAQTAQDATDGRRRAVFVDGGLQGKFGRRAVLSLLGEHVEQNLIKVGNRIYRQKEGIPQGSIMSSLLCSYFYAELERQELSFVTAGNSILLRLIDDFLVISADQAIAKKFVQVMHAGLPEFGVQVKAEKSCTNFEVYVNGKQISRTKDVCDFPYCGNAINTATLNLSKDGERRRTNNVSDSITVEYTKVPGQTFYRKTLNAVKLQLQAMLLSTSFNSLSTVLRNLHNAFLDVAQKAYHYGKSLPNAEQPHDKLLIKTIDDLIKLACALMHRRRHKSSGTLQYECSVSNAQARWLACTAFTEVFHRRQTKHAFLLAWLRIQLASPASRREERVLAATVG